MSLNSMRQKINTLKNEYKLAHITLRNETKRFHEMEERIEDIKQAQEIAQKVAQIIQEQTHSNIAHVVTLCLQTIFPDKDYKFRIDFERKRNKTEAKLVIIKDGNDVDNPLDAESGGVLDVAAFALHLSALMLTKPAIRPILAMDEPFKYVSVEYRDNVRQMLETLSKDFKIQFVLATHMKELMIGKVVKL